MRIVGLRWLVAPCRPRAAQGESGAGAVLAVMLVSLCLVLLVAAAMLGEATASRHQAQAAADLAALAAVDSALGNAAGDPCSSADRVARENSAILVACSVAEAGLVDVTVRVRPPGLPAALGDAVAVARAGPG